MLETASTPYYQNEYSNSSNTSNINEIQNDTNSSLNSSQNKSELIIKDTETLAQKGSSPNDELSAFIKHYFSNQALFQAQVEIENKKPKKSFLICDILGLNYDKETEIPKSEPSPPPIQQTSNAANFLLNLNYSNLVTTLINNKRHAKASDEEYCEQVQLKESNSNNKKMKMDDEEQQDHTLKQQKKGKESKPLVPNLWPAWVYCTRYSDRPSAG